MTRPIALLVAGEPPGEAAVRAWRGRGVECVQGDDLAAPALISSAALPAMLAAAFQAPFAGFVEAGCEPSDHALAAVRGGGLLACLTTAAAYRLDLAELVARVVRRRYAPPSEVADHLELALSEAVSNAVVHGNLGLSSALRQDADGLGRLQRAMAERLTDPALAARPVEVTVRRTGDGLAVTVADRGNGFDLERVLDYETADSSRPFGRGLSLIKSICQRLAGEDGGRRIAMAWTFHADGA